MCKKLRCVHFGITWPYCISKAFKETLNDATVSIIVLVHGMTYHRHEEKKNRRDDYKGKRDKRAITWRTRQSDGLPRQFA
jgi:hypothetical protein